MKPSTTTIKMKSQHGGARPHPPGREGGRPKMKFGRRNLVLDCTEQEYQEIIKTLKNTRQRAKVLLQICRNEEVIEQLLAELKKEIKQ